MVNALLYSFHIIPSIFDFFKIPESTTRLGSHFPCPHQSSSVRTPSSFDGPGGRGTLDLMSPQKISDMMKRIVTETKRPFHIRQLADGFIKDRMGSAEFVSLHWRYDKSDWFKVEFKIFRCMCRTICTRICTAESAAYTEQDQ